VVQVLPPLVVAITTPVKVAALADEVKKLPLLPTVQQSEALGQEMAVGEKTVAGYCSWRDHVGLALAGVAATPLMRVATKAAIAVQRTSEWNRNACLSLVGAITSRT
jgi:hypothetical protein